MNLALHLFVNTLAVLTGSYLLKGVTVDSVTTALVVAIVLGSTTSLSASLKKAAGILLISI
jgi:uncharacterized membrane protein YvlD (DUF360 family)